MKRCAWAEQESMHEYHDKEWGVPVHDDRTLFEFLTLEGAQAGLSWSTILKKRDGYRKNFYNFDVKKIAKISQQQQEKILQDPGIVRNKLKVASTVTNAQAFIELQKEFGSFDKYIWAFVDNKPIVNTFKQLSDIPASTELSDTISKDLKKRGFRFVGSTIIYAFMQAVGMVNDHEVNCFRYKQVGK
jgi:DNA-3-methyladenine glycosylase I